MATKKLMWVLFGILVISAWILGSVVQVGAETLKGRIVLTTTKYEEISVSDEPGHVLAIRIREGLAFFENGEIAKMRNHSIFDTTPGKDSQSINYNIFTFEDGSTVVTRTQRLMVPDKSGNFSAKLTGELIKGTGRFEGIKGTTSATGKNFAPNKGEAERSFNDVTWSYTLPTK
jgi:hypothetical protein